MNCSTGCTIITCNATTCTVNYCNYSGCRVVGSYPRPTQIENRVSGVPAKSINGTRTAPTDAPLQFAAACSDKVRDCRMFVVTPEGSSYVGSYSR